MRERGPFLVSARSCCNVPYVRLEKPKKQPRSPHQATTSPRSPRPDRLLVDNLCARVQGFRLHERGERGGLAEEKALH